MDSRVLEVVERYISVILKENARQYAGWRAEHLMGRIIEFKGDLPAHGGGGDSNANMLYQILFMPDMPQGIKTQRACKMMEVLKKRDSKAANALIATVYLRKRPDPKTGRSHYTQNRIAAELGISRSAYLKKLEAGEEFIRDMVEIASLAQLA